MAWMVWVLRWTELISATSASLELHPSPENMGAMERPECGILRASHGKDPCWSTGGEESSLQPILGVARGCNVDAGIVERHGPAYSIHQLPAGFLRHREYPMVPAARADHARFRRPFMVSVFRSNRRPRRHRHVRSVFGKGR